MVRVTVPATSANMGSGYDSIGIALDLYNIITLEESDHIDISDVHGEKIPIDETNLIYQCAKRVYDICGAPLPGLKIVEDCHPADTRPGVFLGLHSGRHPGGKRPPGQPAQSGEHH